jgi:hypothetical protein
MTVHIFLIRNARRPPTLRGGALSLGDGIAGVADIQVGADDGPSVSNYRASLPPTVTQALARDDRQERRAASPPATELP